MFPFWNKLSAAEKKALSKKLGTSVNHLRHVFLYGKKVGHEMAMKIERETGISKSELRPDIYPPNDNK